MNKKIRLLVACLGVLLACGGCGLQAALDELGAGAEAAERRLLVVEYVADGGVPATDAGIPLDDAGEPTTP